MAKATYVDGFVIAIPKKNTTKYKKMANEGKLIWRRFGALDYKECIIDDDTPPQVSLTFAKLTKAKPSEAVWFSFVTFKSKQHRDAVNKKVMAYFSKKYGDQPMNMPFNMNRMAYAGFKVIVSS